LPTGHCEVRIPCGLYLPDPDFRFQEYLSIVPLLREALLRSRSCWVSCRTCQKCAPSKSITKCCHWVNPLLVGWVVLKVNCEVQSTNGSNQVTMWDWSRRTKYMMVKECPYISSPSYRVMSRDSSLDAIRTHHWMSWAHHLMSRHVSTQSGSSSGRTLSGIYVNTYTG
jgi:hypothetical protein